MPLHNHGNTVCEVLDGIVPSGLRTIVIDDGSTDGGAERVNAWVARHPGQCSIVRMGSNRGKAAAILRGLDEAAEMGATVAITIDADAQHDPAFLPAFERASQGADPVIVLGNRGPVTTVYPLARLVGRTLSGLAVRAACGIPVQDAACGFRAYPINLARQTRCLSGRYAWEEEIIARLVWLGVRVSEISLPVIYHPRSQAHSHYRFRRDWPEGVLVLICVVVQRMFDPSARLGRNGIPISSMAWPLLRTDRLGALLAAFGAGVASTAMALGRIAVPTSLGIWVAAALVLLAAIRTRASLIAVLLGALGGWLLHPVVMAAVSIPMAVILAVGWIAIGRGRG
jgi:glycosyltransferase involved in cell wall biosynthesis